MFACTFCVTKNIKHCKIACIIVVIFSLMLPANFLGDVCLVGKIRVRIEGAHCEIMVYTYTHTYIHTHIYIYIYYILLPSKTSWLWEHPQEVHLLVCPRIFSLLCVLFWEPPFPSLGLKMTQTIHDKRTLYISWDVPIVCKPHHSVSAAQWGMQHAFNMKDVTNQLQN